MHVFISDSSSIFVHTGLEPPEKRPRISLKMNSSNLDGEGTLVINTSDPTQTVSFTVKPMTCTLIACLSWAHLFKTNDVIS